MKEKLLSVGIDIGTSTTQLVFSNIIIENTASQYSIPKVEIKERIVIYSSEIYFTPFKNNNKIDGQALKDIIEKEYKNAGIVAKEVKTGAVIITGEAARKENASLILESLTGFAGDFVIATAGPNLESIIAGRGSGTEEFSKKENCVAINLDIGGGTTNIGVFKNGKVIDAACLDIGSRLIRLANGTMVVEYIAPKMEKFLEKRNISLSKGQELSIEKAKNICKEMTNVLEEILGLAPKSSDLEIMLLGADLKRNYTIDYISFSGGVSDYIYNKNNGDVFKYGDLGILFGKSIYESEIKKRISLTKPYETIRATVVGAGIHTMEVTGSTINYTTDCFPLKNIPIIKMLDEEKRGDILDLEDSIIQQLDFYTSVEKNMEFAISIKGIKNPSFNAVVDIAEAIVRGIGALIKKMDYLIVIVENDMGKALGQTLYSKLGMKKDVICIDGIGVDSGDYIDIGKPVGDGRAVPVVVKTLIFNF